MQTSLQNAEAATLAERAIEAWGDTVYRIALAQTGSRADADDIYQEVFLKLVDEPPAFSDEEHLKAWLIRVTVNRSRDVLRRRSRRPLEPLDAHLPEAERALAQTRPPTGGPDGVDAFDSELWQHVGRLPEEQRTVVNLFYVEELGTREIAAVLGCSDGAVRSRLYRARESLRSSLAASCQQPVQS